MPEYILGISAFYHDAAAALLKDGQQLAAVQEERFTRVKHDPRFPVHAINYCLEEAFIEPSDIDLIVFYDHPLLTYDRILSSCSKAGLKAEPLFTEATQSILGSKLWVSDYVKQTLGHLGKAGKVLFAGHHISHAASAFFPTTFRDAAILTMDGVGEWATSTICKGSENDVQLLAEIKFPHSLGLLYSAFTYYCGFKINSGEYKLMGLAPYGEPKYAQTIYDHLIDVKEDGSFRLNMAYFAYENELRTINEEFESLLGGAARKPESRITKKEMDLAASIQLVTEEIVEKLSRTAINLTGSKNLCLAGGVALNCVANGKLLNKNIFDNIWIQPASGDAGGAVGAAYVGHYIYNKHPRKYPDKTEQDLQHGSYLGPAYSEQEILAFLDRHDLSYYKYEDGQLLETLAAELDEGKIIGFFNGRMEFGPRALGGRSIIGDARNKHMQSRMNLKIKYRESFRPFAPIVLEEDAHAYFEISEKSPYMLLVAPVKASRRTMQEKPKVDDFGEDMINIINQERSDVPAVTHVDFSARIQTVDEKRNKRLYELLKAFKERTGYGVLVNTSFNVRGEPIVCTPEDAYRCFMRTGMDVLVLDNFVLYKHEQPEWEEKENWKDTFELD